MSWVDDEPAAENLPRSTRGCWSRQRSNIDVVKPLGMLEEHHVRRPGGHATPTISTTNRRWSRDSGFTHTHKLQRKFHLEISPLPGPAG